MREQIAAFKVNPGDSWEFTDSVQATPGTNGRVLLAVKLRHESDPSSDLWVTSAPVQAGRCTAAGDSTWTELRVRSVAVPAAGGYRVAEVFAEFDGHTAGEWFLGGLAAERTVKVAA